MHSVKYETSILLLPNVGGQIYGFDFGNDEDYLEYQYALLVWYGDGSVYELPVQLGKVKPPFVPDWIKSFFPIILTSDMVWVHKR